MFRVHTYIHSSLKQSTQGPSSHLMTPMSAVATELTILVNMLKFITYQLNSPLSPSSIIWYELMGGVLLCISVLLSV